jgi:hypothetical protein
MATLDDFLNAIIPWIVGIAGVWILYRPLRPILKPLFERVGNGLGWIKRKITGEEAPEWQEMYRVPSLQYE